MDLEAYFSFHSIAEEMREREREDADLGVEEIGTNDVIGVVILKA